MVAEKVETDTKKLRLQKLRPFGGPLLISWSPYFGLWWLFLAKQATLLGGTFGSLTVSLAFLLFPRDSL